MSENLTKKQIEWLEALDRLADPIAEIEAQYGEDNCIALKLRSGVEFFRKKILADKKSKNKSTGSHEGMLFADWFKADIVQDRIKVTPNMLVLWQKVYDKLIDRGEKKETIIAVCRWAHTDSFWKENFLSATKLTSLNKDKIPYYDYFKNKARSAGRLKAPAHKDNTKKAHAGDMLRAKMIASKVGLWDNDRINGMIAELKCPEAIAYVKQQLEKA